MNFEKIELDSFSVVGISVITTNADNQSQKDISALWMQFFSENIMQQIPNKASEDVYCIYTDYETDFNGKYTTIIGCKVTELDSLSEKWTVKEIEASKYYKFVSKGEIHQAVGTTWMHIWNTDYPRRYLADFEIYNSKSQDPILPEVETYLSIK